MVKTVMSQKPTIQQNNKHKKRGHIVASFMLGKFMKLSILFYNT